MPIDEEKSNSNWIIQKKKCECGGTAEIKL